MSQALKSLAIGKSDLASIINNNCIYIDKTKQVYDLIKVPNNYFLSRPRRFGKSTLISTFNEIFKGNRELFKDQWIYNSPWQWEEYPVIKIDFNGAKDSDLVYYIQNELKKIAIHYDVFNDNDFINLSYGQYFRRLLAALHKKYNRQVVVLIDEYDKPILDVIEDIELAKKNLYILTGFYVVMKGVDEHLRFVFLTGINKLGYVMGFSGLNSLNDISMSEKYADLCGITQSELEEYFSGYIDKLANHEEITIDECLAEIKHWYNGFYFSKNMTTSVYNPFSTLLLFKHLEFSNYWFATGSPSFLIKLIKKETNLNLSKFDNIELYEDDFNNFEVDNLNLHAILFQAGYLTIKNYDKQLFSYTLGYTNYEIEKSFKNNLFNSFFVLQKNNSNYLIEIHRGFINNDVNSVIEVLKQLFLNLDYDIVISYEKHFQSIVYLIFQLLGYYIKVEYKTNIGRIDAIVEVGDNGLFCQMSG